MIKEAIGYGTTIDEAKESAMQKLNAGADEDIQFEVLATPKKKTLGLFGGSKAEVRVYVELPDEKPKTQKKPAVKKQESANKTQPEKKPQPPKKPQPEKKEAPESKPAAEKKEAPKRQQEEKKQPVYGPEVSADKLAADSQAAKAVTYIKSILTGLGCENITVKVAESENGALISLDGDGLGVVIGHRGETLDSLQYLTSLAANNGKGYYKVSLNIGNFREKREGTLIALAKRVSEQVLSTGQSRGLEPMNPYERRIIHTAVQEIDGVVSASFGDGSSRRVVIAPEGVEIKPPRNDGRRDGGRDRRGRSDRGGRSGGRDRRPNNTVATAPTREPKKDTDNVPLYGKIN